jgi:hypothetical protein
MLKSENELLYSIIEQTLNKYEYKLQKQHTDLESIGMMYSESSAMCKKKDALID